MKLEQCDKAPEPNNPRVTYSDTPSDDAAQDELGKVWDALHAAGINGEGGMTAAEGVRELVKRNVNANYGTANKACGNCAGSGFVQPDVAIEVCGVCDGKG